MAAKVTVANCLRAILESNPASAVYIYGLNHNFAVALLKELKNDWNGNIQKEVIGQEIIGASPFPVSVEGVLGLVDHEHLPALMAKAFPWVPCAFPALNGLLPVLHFIQTEISAAIQGKNGQVFFKWPSGLQKIIVNCGDDKKKGFAELVNGKFPDLSIQEIDDYVAGRLISLDVSVLLGNHLNSLSSQQPSTTIDF